MNVTACHFMSHLKNCSARSKERATWQFSKYVIAISRKLYEEGFIQSYRVVPDPEAKGVVKKKIEVDLRYYFGKPIFKKLKFLSTPAAVRQLRYDQIAQINGKKDVVFVSTTKGILTLEECKKNQIGGTMLFVC